MSRSAFDPLTDYYGLLGVSPGSPPEEIRAAYRRLAKAYHPDLNAGSQKAAARMARINHAKSILLDETTRRAYDAARQRYVGPAMPTYQAARSQPRPAATGVSFAAAAPRPAVASVRQQPVQQAGWGDRQTFITLLVALPLLALVLVYVADAAQTAARPARPWASDLALAPTSRPNVEGTARAAFSLVAGRPPSRQAGASANQVIANLVDGVPEAESLRAIGRQLQRAGRDGDTEAWDAAVSELCIMARHC